MTLERRTPSLNSLFLLHERINIPTIATQTRVANNFVFIMLTFFCFGLWWVYIYFRFNVKSSFFVFFEENKRVPEIQKLFYWYKEYFLFLGRYFFFFNNRSKLYADSFGIFEILCDCVFSLSHFEIFQNANV